MRTREEDNDPDVFTLEEAASKLRMSPETVRTRLLDGDFPNAYQTGPRGSYRIPEADVQQFKSKYSPHSTQSRSSGVPANGDPEPGPTERDASAEMPSGSLIVERAVEPQENHDDHRAASA